LNRKKYFNASLNRFSRHHSSIGKNATLETMFSTKEEKKTTTTVMRRKNEKNQKKQKKKKNNNNKSTSDGLILSIYFQQNLDNKEKRNARLITFNSVCLHLIFFLSLIASY